MINKCIKEKEMKKNCIKIGVIIFITFLFYNCNNEFLERYPLDEISSETFWNTENDLRTYNNYLYDLASNERNTPILMGHTHGRGSNDGYLSVIMNQWFIDIFSDNIAAATDQAIYLFLNTRAGIHTVPRSNFENNQPLYGGYSGWNLVRAINIGLNNYNNADIAQSTIDKYAGEAHLFRGWFYADKVQKYGDVSWVEKELNIDSEELYAPRTPREQVMEHVLADINFACEKLPDDWGDGNAPGRINRWGALLVKSRVCLFEGTWRKYHGGSNAEMWLEEAAKAAKELIEDGPYSLYVTGNPDHDYNASHRMNDLTGNPEVIYWRRYQYGIRPNNVMINTYNYRDLGATKSMVEDYLCTDGLPISLSPLYEGDENYDDIFKNRDPRLRQTILHPDDQSYYNFGRSEQYDYPRVSGLSGGLTSVTGYHIIKVYDAATEALAWNQGETPAIYMRLGEAMLNYAEARAELGTIIQADLDMSINKLRDRVAMPHMVLANIPVDPIHAGDGASPLIVEIRRERRIELFLEGFRYDDLRRWRQGKKLENHSIGMRWDDAAKAKYDPNGDATVRTSEISGIEYIDVYKGTEWGNPVFNEGKHYLWPIPLSDLSQNPDLGQNPEW